MLSVELPDSHGHMLQYLLVADDTPQLHLVLQGQIVHSLPTPSTVTAVCWRFCYIFITVYFSVCMYVSGHWHIVTVNRLVHWGYATLALVCTWMGDRISMSISVDSPSDETLNRGPVALLLQRQYEFPFGINIVQFSFSFFFMYVCLLPH